MCYTQKVFTARKGVLLFKSNLTRLAYEELITSFQLTKSELSTRPFVYADPHTGEIRLLTSLYLDEDEELTALSTSAEGDLEFLST